MSTCRMAVVTELMARSLTAEELANRLLDHPDVAVRQLARYCIDGDTQTRVELQEAKQNAEDWERDAGKHESDVSEAESLLDDCLDALGDDSTLAKSIQKWLSR